MATMDQVTESFVIGTRIQALRVHLRELETQESYLDAEQVRDKITELSLEKKQTSARNLSSRQDKERVELELAHDQEFELFKSAWETRLSDYRKAAGKLEEELKIRHVQALEKHVQAVARTLPLQPKPSGELLAARKTKAAMVKTQHYKEAHDLTEKIAALEEAEAERFLHSTQDKIEQARKQLLSKQSLEFAALQQKSDIGFQELLRQREADIERLSKRFKNATFELHNLHGMIRANSSTKIEKLVLAPKRVQRILTTAKSGCSTPVLREVRSANSSRRPTPKKGGDETETGNA